MKKFIKWTLSLTGGILVLIIALMILLDPLYQYHMPWFGLNMILSNDEQYYVPGLAKTLSYRNAIIGTSMSENFRVSWFNDLFKGATVKLTIAGSHSREYHKVLDLVFEHGNADNIVMNIDCPYLVSNPETGRWAKLPDYLYDSSLLNDVNYLLNKEIFFTYGISFLAENAAGQTADFDGLFTWGDKSSFGKEMVLQCIDSNIFPYGAEQIAEFYRWTEANMASLTAAISNHPEIHFTIYAAPSSIAWWYIQREAGLIDFWEDTYLELFDEMTGLDNVSLYFFADSRSKEIITDLNNYTDTEHYNPDINRYIFECFQTGHNLVTADLSRKIGKDFFSFIRNYDYTSLF